MDVDDMDTLGCQHGKDKWTLLKQFCVFVLDYPERALPLPGIIQATLNWPPWPFQLNSLEIQPGKPLKVNVSVPNTRLFVGNIPKSKSREDICAEFEKLSGKVQNLHHPLTGSFWKSDFFQRKSHFLTVKSRKAHVSPEISILRNSSPSMRSQNMFGALSFLLCSIDGFPHNPDCS